MSLRNYLLVSILLIITGVGGITIWSSYKASRYEVQDLFDAQLSRSARLLLSMAITDIREGDIHKLQDMLKENAMHLKYEIGTRKDAVNYKTGHNYETKLAFQVWDLSGNMLLRSANAPLAPFSNEEPGYSDRNIDGTDWRIFSLWGRDHEYLVMAAERYDVRMELVEAITQRVLLPFLMMLPVLALLLWLAVGRGLAPLKRVAQEVENRDEHYLDSIDESNVPSEVAPLIRALNRLFDILKNSLEKERRFTSDAAHELRTPLAALKTHAQLAKSSTEVSDREHAISQLLVGVDRASHVVDQLLALSRLEPGISQSSFSVKNRDLHELTVSIAVDLVMLAEAKQIELSVEDTGEVSIQGDATSLSILIRNLLDNAIRYTPEGGVVQVLFKQTPSHTELQVIDSGPGIEELYQKKVFERFYRGDNKQQTGCGIGLSIVKRIADLHKASVRIQNLAQGSGLLVIVAFPAGNEV